MSKSLPLPASVETESAIPAVKGNGMNAAFDQTVHCIAAEPDATLFRVSVSDGSGQEVAYETAVLGRLRRGYRILQLRSPLGTRIELCYLFVKISFGSVPNLWATPRQVRPALQSTRSSGCTTCNRARHVRVRPCRLFPPLESTRPMSE